MDLREIKTEISSLPGVAESLQKFQDSWIKPVKANANKHIPFLKELSPKAGKEIDLQLNSLQKIMEEIKYSQVINQKLSHFSRYLVELKLTTFNGDLQKQKSIIKLLQGDDYLKMQNIIKDIQQFESNIKALRKEYNKINSLLQKELPLEDSVLFMGLPHQAHLNELSNISSRHKSLARHLEEQFISMVKETKNKKEA